MVPSSPQTTRRQPCRCHPQIPILCVQSCCTTSRRRRQPWHGHARPLCERNRCSPPTPLARGLFLLRCRSVATSNRSSCHAPVGVDDRRGPGGALGRLSTVGAGRVGDQAAPPYRRHAPHALAGPGPRGPSWARAWRPGPPRASAQLAGLGAGPVWRHAGYGSASRGKPRALAVRPWGGGAGGAWGWRGHAPGGDGQAPGRRHPPHAPHASARRQWRWPTRRPLARAPRAAVGNEPSQRRPGAGADPRGSGGRRCAGVACVGGTRPDGPPPEPGAESAARSHAQRHDAVVGRVGPRLPPRGSCPAACRHPQRPGPRAMAKRGRDTTVAKRVGCRPVTRPRRSPVGRGLVAGEAAVCLRRSAACAPTTGGRLASRGWGATRAMWAGVAAEARGGARPPSGGRSLARGGRGSVRDGHQGTATPQKTARPPRRGQRHVA